MAKKSKPKTKAARPKTIRHWTKDELKSLRTGVKNGVKARDIATALHRTEGAIRQKAFALELSFRAHGPRRKKKAT